MRRFGGFTLALVAIGAAGCRPKDPIAHYKAPKDPTWRMIAAIVPQADQAWFFKAVGPSARLAERKEEVLRFLRSVTFADGKPQWALPEGWREEKGGAERFATMKFAGTDSPLELSVSSAGGDLLANVNRWRGQLGLVGVSAAELGTVTTTLEIGGAKATVVDFEGPKKPTTAPFAGGGMMPRTPDASPSEGASDPLSFDAPAGWVRNPHPQSPKVLEFQAGGARVALSFMSGESGGLVANVNRWRGQLGLGPLDEVAIQKLLQPVVVMGIESNGLELTTTDKAIVCVFRLDSRVSMFLKMDGPADDVEKQKSAFWKFARTLKLNTKHG